ncbi:phage holin family protein [Cohnella fermenti]|uniref:Phage holin family protein n=1 Tax=Cohnella fermenti TaxID=2565925 RepID=A0A4S4BSP6_9BACL|nr:phage holin family protein [Cohnella fermenti]
MINWITGLIGAFITFAFGHWTEPLTFLLTIIAIDIISGMYASMREGSGLNSAVGTVGLAKKGLMLLVILLGYRVDVLLGSEMIMGGAIYFYIANELVSVTENCGRIGLPIPNKLRQVIAVLKQKGEEEEEV